MKGTRHSEEQIIAILKQGEAGLQGKSVPQSCEQAHILLQTASMKGSKAAELPLTSLLLQVGRVG
jgi:hypothetical protein